jgi:hypothetical protein
MSWREAIENSTGGEGYAKQRYPVNCRFRLRKVAGEKAREGPEADELSDVVRGKRDFQKTWVCTCCFNRLSSFDYEEA